MAGAQRVLLGHIVGAHGIRGEVEVRTYTARPEDIAAYGALEDESGGRHFEITSVRQGAKGLIARIKGIADRTAAEGLRGTALYVARAKLPPLEDGEFYHSDLIGLDAVDETGAVWGRVVAVLNFGAGDLLEIEPAGGKSTELVPFKTAFVPVVDVPAGRLVVLRPPEVVADPDANGEA